MSSWIKMWKNLKISIYNVKSLKKVPIYSSVGSVWNALLTTCLSAIVIIIKIFEGENGIALLF